MLGRHGDGEHRILASGRPAQAAVTGAQRLVALGQTRRVVLENNRNRLGAQLVIVINAALEWSSGSSPWSLLAWSLKSSARRCVASARGWTPRTRPQRTPS